MAKRLPLSSFVGTEGIVALTDRLESRPSSFRLRGENGIDVWLEGREEPVGFRLARRSANLVRNGLPLALCEIDGEYGPVRFTPLDRAEEVGEF